MYDYQMVIHNYQFVHLILTMHYRTQLVLAIKIHASSFHNLFGLSFENEKNYNNQSIFHCMQCIYNNFEL